MSILAHPGDGGPAFPVLDDVEFESGHALELKDPGLSRRDFFAAFAPEVPNWFEHVRPPQEFPPRPDPVKFFSPDDFVSTRPGRPAITAVEWAAGWLRGDFELLMPEQVTDAGLRARFEKFEVAGRAHLDAKRAWQAADRLAVLVQWRFAYASAMVAEAERPAKQPIARKVAREAHRQGGPK